MSKIDRIKIKTKPIETSDIHKCGLHDVYLAKYLKSSRKWICQIPECDTEINNPCGSDRRELKNE